MLNNTFMVLTAEFPFGKGETFLETEALYLSQAFERVIFVACSTTSKEQRLIPANCKAIQLQVSPDFGLKTRSLIGIFNAEFWKELRIVRHIYRQKISLQILKTMLISLVRGRKIAQYLPTISDAISSTVFYSYWCEDSALALALLKKKLPIKAVSRMHGWDVYFNVHDLHYLPFRSLIAENVRLFAISVQGKSTVQQVWQVKTQVQLARLGTKTTQFLSTHNEVFTIFSCSNLIPIKRVHLLAEALQFLSVETIRWIHFGDGSEMEKLRQKIEKLPKNIQVELRGRIPNEAIFRAYETERPHLFINVSSSEGVPVSIMEAMSFGVPVIATNVGGNNEIVSQKNGVLLKSNPTVEEISQAIKYFIHLTPDTYTSFSNYAYQTWKNDYNAEKNYNEFGKMLKEM